MNEAAIPKHIGFILDGNRRWAVDNGLPKLVGHKKGYENLKTIADECFSRGIGIVSTYIFSTENWNRELEEVNYLMDLALKLFKKDLNELMDKDIKVVVSGSREKLSEKIIKAIDSTVSKTANNKKGTINICFNYGGQSEIADAVAKIIESKADASQITTELIRNNLYQPELPPVDYIIRTSGEKRLSNFLLWDSAYAELEFVSAHWPAFSSQDLDLALAEYANRKRRFGK
ncbi:MAG: polyprenyl diphosphate synthase [Candidatus Saccharibacteria bacterium]